MMDHWCAEKGNQSWLNVLSELRTSIITTLMTRVKALRRNPTIETPTLLKPIPGVSLATAHQSSACFYVLIVHANSRSTDASNISISQISRFPLTFPPLSAPCALFISYAECKKRERKQAERWSEPHVFADSSDPRERTIIRLISTPYFV